jgi:hypothetical protein
MADVSMGDRSLTVFRVRFKRTYPSNGAPMTLDTRGSEQLKVLCALEVTGDPSTRGLQPVEEQVAPTRRAGPRSSDSVDARMPTRTVAQWILSPTDLDLPMTYEEACELHDRGNRAYDALTAGARSATSALLDEYKADTVINSVGKYVRAAHWIPSPTYRLPPDITRDLQRLLPNVLEKGEHLWVELAEPVGYLPLIAWEALLQPLVSTSVLRLSPHPIQALGSNQELTVVIACSFPSPKWLPKTAELRTLLSAVTGSLPPKSTVHIFADAIARPGFAEIVSALMKESGSIEIKLHPVPEFDAFTTSSGSTGDGFAVRDHPWLDWMTNRIGVDAVDIFHWISPAALLPDGARLVVARHPAGTEESEEPEHSGGLLFWKKKARARTVRFLDASSLASAATGFGAWAMIFSAAVRGRTSQESLIGLRLLSDQLSRLRPGVVALHELDRDIGAPALSSAYKFLAGATTGYSSTSAGIAMYCHPDRASLDDEDLTPDTPLYSAYAAVKEVARAVLNQPGPSPAWVATTQRLCEQVASPYVQSAHQPSEKSSLDEASERGVAAALQVVEQIMSERLPQ